MLLVISYIFKVIFCAIFSSFYLSLIEDDEQSIINYFLAPLICLTVFHLCNIELAENRNIMIGILFLFLIQINLWITEEKTMQNKIIMLVLTINGAILGLGNIFLSIIYSLLFYLALKNKDYVISTFSVLRLEENEIKKKKDDN